MDYTKVDITSITKWLQDNLNQKRYIHSIGTAECARDLALQFGLDPEKAYIAGLLHDCAKCFAKDKLLQIINDFLDVEKDELMNHKTLHAPVSAYVAQKTFGIEDEEILSAVRWHTLGKINMSDFEKIIFLADKIEPKTREKSYISEVRMVLQKADGLNKALLICYKETIKSLVKRDLKICPVTVDIYNALQDITYID